MILPMGAMPCPVAPALGSPALPPRLSVITTGISRVPGLAPSLLPIPRGLRWGRGPVGAAGGLSLSARGAPHFDQ